MSLWLVLYFLVILYCHILITYGSTGTHGEGKYDLSNARAVDFKPVGSGRGGHFSVDNG